MMLTPSLEIGRYYDGDGAAQWAGLCLPPALDPDPVPDTKERTHIYRLLQDGGWEAVQRVISQKVESTADVALSIWDRSPSEQPITLASSTLRDVGRLKIELEQSFPKNDRSEDIASAIARFRHDIRPSVSELYRFLSITHRSFDLLLQCNYGKPELAERILACRDPRCEVGTFNFCWDDCDLIIDRLLGIRPPPKREMCVNDARPPYQPTPARMALELVSRLGLCEESVFYDIGCGLYRVPAMVALVSSARVAGIEIDPVLAKEARALIDRIDISDRARVLEGDISSVDVSDGTHFFLFSSFTGDILRQTISQIEKASRKHPTHVVAHGACVYELADYLAARAWSVTKHHDGQMRFGNAAWEFHSPSL